MNWHLPFNQAHIQVNKCSMIISSAMRIINLENVSHVFSISKSRNILMLSHTMLSGIYCNQKALINLSYMDMGNES